MRLPLFPPIVLGIYDRSHVMGELWEASGYDVRYFDMQSDGRDFRLTEYITEPVVGLWAFPPCDHLARSGALWWETKGEGPLLDGLSTADAVLRAVALLRPEWWVLENPVGRLATYYGPPRFKFDPYEFAGYLDDPGEEAHTKRTWLWGDFVIPQRRPVECLRVDQTTTRFGSTQKNLRSLTPRGFARAFFYANSGVS